MNSKEQKAPELARAIGLPGAVLLGLGSILGTGVFVSIGIGAGIAGSMVLPALFLAGLVAVCNGMSSAQLAAAHPVSGGSYEYGYQFVSPAVGFTAGWMFLCAKSASAATAALGLAGYVLNAVAPRIGPGAGTLGDGFYVPVAVGATLLLTGVTLTGVQRSSRVNAAIVCMTLGALGFFVGSGLPVAMDEWGAHSTPDADALSILEAAALMFVAYTGYGRVATLGEEVRDPRTTIPKAIGATLLATLLIYGAVGGVAVGSVGPEAFYLATIEAAAPLEVIGREFGVPGLPGVMAIGAVTAMAGVLLNLILGLSRVLLAMGRRGDAPNVFAAIGKNQVPSAAIIAIGIFVAGLALIGSVRTTWSFSAFTVLVYYAITNVCALKLPADARLYPSWISWAGLVGCLSLAFFVEVEVWLTGLALIAIGLVWHWVRQKSRE